ncbi:MAG TPA: HD domain-containing protein [Tissierellia bacterium]|nr:HD domain-containing protein [Tissierellia bacterium]
MIKDWFYDKLKENIGELRYEHSLRVMEKSVELAKIYNVSVEKAAVAGLLHDCGKLKGGINLLKLAEDFDIILDSMTKNNHELIHSVLGAAIAEKEYGIVDEDVLNAIRFHTTGRENMSKLEKIVYIADMIEPGRSFEGVDDIRKLALVDLDKALILSIDNTLKFVIEKRKLIHLDSVKARNQLLIQKSME